MKARHIEFGGMVQISPGIYAERVTSHYYKKCWRKKLPEGYVAFCTPIPNDKLDWWLVERDAEVDRVGTTEDLGSRN